MEITINGAPHKLSSGSTLLAVLDALNIEHDRQGIAIAVGMSVIPRSLWAQKVLNQGDRVEVVTAAQGG